MPTMKCIDACVAVEADFPELLHGHTPDWMTLIEALNKFWMAQSAPGLLDFVMRNDGAYWFYRFRHRDGRTWKHHIVIPPGNAEPSMTDDTNGHYWKLSEFVPHRLLRDHSILLVRNGCTEIRASFTAKP